MAVVRLEALKGLACAITDAIPELRNRICLGQADPRKDLQFPSLNIDPIRYKYDPNQAQERHEPSVECVVMQVGAHAGTLQLRLITKTSDERAVLEQKIIDLFLETPLHPGVLLTVISSCPSLGDFLAAWEFDTDEWDDEGVFNGHFYSVIALAGILPALVTRGSSHTIEQLQLGLTHDFDAEFNPTTFNTSALVEVVEINQDGTIQAV
jgi:hypothetical protein